MFRYSSSFIFSVLFHICLAVLFVFAYKEIFKTTQKKEKKICVKLCCIEQKQLKKVLKPKPHLKKTYKPKKKINKQKPKKILPPKKAYSTIPIKKEKKI